MVAPCCLMHREGGTFEELPAYDLSMQSDAAVVRDHGPDVFICKEALRLDILYHGSYLHTRILLWSMQEARFPRLQTLTIEQWTKLKSFVSFDDPSFCERVRSLRVVPPEPS